MRISTNGLPISQLLIGAIPAALLAGTWISAKIAVDHLLYHDAVMTARSWTTYLVDNVKDLEEIAKGGKPSSESQAFFERAQEAGRVFRYVIYDPDGHSRFVSDDRKDHDPQKSDELKLRPGSDETSNEAGARKSDDDDVRKSDDDDDDDGDLATHNPAAARAIAAGQPLINAEDGEPPSRPEFFSEAYLPAVANGKTIAIVETYIDQTEKRDEYRRTLILLSAALLLLIGIAFGVPGYAWLRRSNEKRLADAHIRYLAHHDSLTGLINRNKLTEEAGAALARAVKDGAQLALHYIDIDHFKNINDTLGHDAGDALIKSIANRLKTMALGQDLVSRIGGDEFVVLQTNAVNDQAVAALAENIQGSLSGSYELNGHASNVTVSIGVASAPRDGDSIARLMKSADLALYASKTGGRNRVSFFKAELDKELGERLRIERAIQSALLSESFELYYQPAVAMPEGRLVGFEALLRMRDETGAMISPAIFVPIAEQMGLIDKIGEWVLREACRTANNWPNHLKIAVNLSPAQFAHGLLCEKVARILTDAGLDAGRLELEITEGLLLTKSEEVLEELRKLKELGVSIVMDDFGTGYSSLSYLWQFPFDKIKIDRAFMLGLDAENHVNAETIVRTIIDLGRSLSVTVTVEGAETARQVQFLTEAHCDQIQGFYFGRPMPSIDLAAHIARSTRASAEKQTETAVALQSATR
jgi:diguanylate cyclase (GGDEF)-like protein